MYVNKSAVEQVKTFVFSLIQHVATTGFKLEVRDLPSKMLFGFEGLNADGTKTHYTIRRSVVKELFLSETPVKKIFFSSRDDFVNAINNGKLVFDNEANEFVIKDSNAS